MTVFRLLSSFIICVFPFQVLAIRFGTTVFDVFPILISLFNLFFLLSYLFSAKSNKITIGLLKVLFCFLIFTIIYILYHPQPIYRFISAFFWLFNLSLLFLTSENYKSIYLWRNFSFISFFVACFIYIEFFILNVDRPKAFFLEPSTTGLLLYSLAFYYFVVLFNSKEKNRLNFFLFLFYFVAGIATKSSHLFVFLIFTIYFFLAQLSNSNRIYFSLIFLFVVFSFGSVINFDYYLNKFDFTNLESLNTSQLSWLRGFDQAYNSVLESPILGNGLGSTGFISFSSNYSDQLDLLSASDLNLLDAYSLFLRLTIEIGFIFTLIIVIYFIKPLNNALNSLINNKNSISDNLEKFYVIGIFIFVGSLLKEPNYGVSLLFISVLFLGIYKNSFLHDKKHSKTS
jgi:hypothetical protein